MIIPGYHLISLITPQCQSRLFSLMVDTLGGKVYCSHTIDNVHLITGAAPLTHIGCDKVES